jgi:Protein of unknown function (DUF4012)
LTRRRRRILGRVGLLVLLAGVWVLACAVLLTRARSDASNGLASVSAAEKQTEPRELLEGQPTALLADAEKSFRDARNRLKNPILTPVRWMPVLGRQLRAATAMASAATTVTDVGADAVAEAKAALELPHATGPERVAMLRALGDAAGRADARLRTVNLGPSRALFEPLADKRAELEDKLNDVRQAVGDGAVVTKGLADVFAGPRRYLVLAANNAEMRAGSGMFLSAGELNFADGQMSLGEFKPTGDIGLSASQAPPINDADLQARWGFLNPNREWRNLAASPRFPASAQLAARMWPNPIDGVLVLDPVGLSALLKVTGPVGPVTADNVVDILTHDQYVGLPPPSARFDAVQAARREQLGLIAKQIVDKLSNSSFDVTTLGDSLAEAVRGRHLLAWSARAGDADIWSRADTDGALEASSLMVSVLNRAGNKLDRFLDIDAELLLQPGVDDQRAKLTITLDNRTPDGENVYVAGPYPGSGVGAGDYSGILAVTLPGFAGAVAVEGFSTFTAAGPDGPTQVVAVPAAVPKGQQQTFTVTFSLPARGSLRVEPSARIPAISWTLPGQQGNDTKARTVTWD